MYFFKKSHNVIKLIFLFQILMIVGVNAQTKDSEVYFSSSSYIYGLQQVYVELTYNDLNLNGIINGGFAISTNPFSSFGSEDAGVYIDNSTGLRVRNTANSGFESNSAIIPECGQLIKLWFLLDVTNKRYKVYAQTGDLLTPRLIYDGYSAFRNGSGAIQYGLRLYSAWHNDSGDQLTVSKVEIHDYNAVITYINTELNDQIDNSHKIEVNPTQTSSAFKVKVDGNNSILTVYSLAGNLIKQIEFNKEETFYLDQPGIYIAKVRLDDYVKVFKLIKN